MFKTIKRLVSIHELINSSYTRIELRTFAKKMGIPIGKDKQNTIENIIKAASENKIAIHVTVNLI